MSGALSILFNSLLLIVLICSDGAGSESEMEEGDTQVTLPQDFVGRNNRSKEQRSVRLVEIGPRLTLQLLKVQKGFCEGDVLYHKYSTYIRIIAATVLICF